MPLKKNDILRFQKRLEEMRQQIVHMVKESSEDVRSVEQSRGYSQHQADEGTDNFDRNISLELTTKEYELLKQIDRALEKISDNTYGICDLTGEEIPLPRLEAIPYATMTVKAQEKLEKGLL